MSTFNKPTNPSAFPWNITHSGNSEKALLEGHGMTLRDYMAAQALTGAQIWDAVINGKNAVLATESGAKTLAEIAYVVADAMLAAREKA